LAKVVYLFGQSRIFSHLGIVIFAVRGCIFVVGFRLLSSELELLSQSLFNPSSYSIVVAFA